MVLRVIAGIVLVLLLTADMAPAQDAHYWNKQYGNRAYMLGGAVIGSSDDVSAVYYNPALLTISDRPNLTVVGSAYTTSSIALKSVHDDSTDLTSSSVGAVPSLIAGEIPLGDRKTQRLAYSLLFRQNFDVIMEQRSLLEVPDLPDAAAVNVGLEENIDEIWSGLTYARRLNQTVSLGASVYATYRTHRSRRSILAAAENDTAFGIAATRDDFDYNQIGLLAKLGVGGRSGPWRYGVTITTPTVRLAGTGSRGVDRLLVNGTVDGELNDIAIFDDYQDELSSSYKTPVSIGGGIAYRISRTTLHVSAEWFASIDPYRILDAEPVNDDDTTVPVDPDLITSRNSVVNWAVGLEHEFGERFRGYLGYHTDRSAAVAEDFRGPVSIWDNDHFAGGLSLNLQGKQISLGVVYARGDAPLSGGLDLVPDDSDGGEATSEDQEIEAQYRSFMILLGFGVDY